MAARLALETLALATLASLLGGATGSATAAALTTAPPPPPCHAPWGNEKSLESLCFTPVLTQGDVSVRRYAPRGASYEQAFLSLEVPKCGGNPAAYEADIVRAVFDMLLYFQGDNSATTVVNRTAPILGRPNTTGACFYDWMLPTTVYPRPAKAPAPPAGYGLLLQPSTLGSKTLVAALHFTVTGVPQVGDFDQACKTLLPLLPSLGYKPVASGARWSPAYAYYTSRDFPGQHDGECLLEVLKA